MGNDHATWSGGLVIRDVDVVCHVGFDFLARGAASTRPRAVDCDVDVIEIGSGIDPPDSPVATLQSDPPQRQLLQTAISIPHRAVRERLLNFDALGPFGSFQKRAEGQFADLVVARSRGYRALGARRTTRV